MDQLYKRILEDYQQTGSTSILVKLKRIKEESRTPEEFHAAENKLVSKKLETLIRQMPLAMQLHLELDMEWLKEEDKEILRKYGRMQEAISRDFIVPGNITLRALHYAIQRAFGWQNSHLHSFEPKEEEFQQMTDGGQIKEWARQVGMYFRFPQDDEDDDLWDMDYDEDMSFKFWLKTKYLGPYSYDTWMEQHVFAQHEMENLLKQFPALKKKTTDQYDWPLIVNGRCEELVERNALWRVLLPPNQDRDWSEWKAEREEILKAAEEGQKKIKKQLLQQSKRIQWLDQQIGAYYENNEIIPGEVDKIEYGMREIKQKECKIAQGLNPEAIPVLSALLYHYDFGDGWKIKITCTNAWYDRSTYAKDEEEAFDFEKEGFVPEVSLFQDAFGQEVTGEELERILTVTRKQKPICVAWDGLKLVDDVGGILGFCEFLKTIHGADPEEKECTLEWAKDLGWTGRMPKKPENVL